MKITHEGKHYIVEEYDRRVKLTFSPTAEEAEAALRGRRQFYTRTSLRKEETENSLRAPFWLADHGWNDTQNVNRFRHGRMELVRVHESTNYRIFTDDTEGYVQVPVPVTPEEACIAVERKKYRKNTGCYRISLMVIHKYVERAEKSLGTWMYATGWIEGQDTGTWYNGDIWILRTNGSWVVEEDTQTVQVPVALTPHQARVALSLGKKSVTLHEIHEAERVHEECADEKRLMERKDQRKMAKSHNFNSKLGDRMSPHTVRHPGVVVTDFANKWGIWPEDNPSGEPWAVLDFSPTKEEAKSALELSPTKGKSKPFTYSREQIHRYMNRNEEDRRKQREVASMVHDHDHGLRRIGNPLCADCKEPIDPKLHAVCRRQGRHHWHEGCEHPRDAERVAPSPTCYLCQQPLKVIHPYHRDGNGRYHPRCWNDLQTAMGWSKLRAGNLDAWQHDGIRKVRIMTGPNAGEWSLAREGSDTLIRANWNVCVEEAYFLLKLSGGERQDMTIDSETYFELKKFEETLDKMRSAGITIDQNALDRISKEQGERFEDFVARRNTPPPPATEPPVSVGSVVQVRATDLDVRWKEAFVGVIETFLPDGMVRVRRRIGPGADRFGHPEVKWERCTLLHRKEDL